MSLKIKILIAMQTLTIVGLAAIIMWLVYSQIPREAEETSLNVVQGQISADYLDEKANYRVSGNKIYLDMPGYGQIWLPVLSDVPACERDPKKYVSRNGQMFYMQDQKITSKLGIDVSSYQGEIDWDAVHSAGVDFVFLRCGYRGYGSGEMVTDTNFAANLEGARNAGLKVGVYFYSQAISKEEALEEADLTLSLIGDTELEYPVVYDWEMVPDDTARTDSVSVETLTDCAAAFCDRIGAAGYTPMIYQNKRLSLLKLDLPRLQNYDFWLAEYSDRATYYYDYRIWQYCSDGHVPGIDGDVDMNICFEPYA